MSKMSMVYYDVNKPVRMEALELLLYLYKMER